MGEETTTEIQVELYQRSPEVETPRVTHRTNQISSKKEFTFLGLPFDYNRPHA